MQLKDAIIEITGRAQSNKLRQSIKQLQDKIAKYKKLRNISLGALFLSIVGIITMLVIKFA